MKVLFLNPSRAGQGNIPLNMPILAAAMKRRGHAVRIFDMSDYAVFDDKSYETMFFKEASLDTERVASDRRAFYGDGPASRLGCGLKHTDYAADFDVAVREFLPDIIAVSCLSSDFAFARDLLLPFKKRYNLPVIFGGIHSILVPDEVISSEACDFVCVGEAETGLPDLLDALEGKGAVADIRGIWHKRDGRVVKSGPARLTDMAGLPLPDLSGFDPIHFYRPFDGRFYKMLNYELSRGCPFDCTYCVNCVLKERYRGLGRYHRIKSAGQSIGELKALVAAHGFDFIRFWDEDFTSIGAAYLKKYAGIYSREISLPFLIYARAETITEEKVRLLKSMGCRTFAIGVESGSEFIRNRVMNRRMSNDTLIEKFDLVKSHGIRVSAYNIIGLPHERREHIFETIEMNRRIDPDSFSVTLLEPYKGTPIRSMCEELGLDPAHETTFTNRPQFIPEAMTADELMGLFRTFAFYVKFPRERYDDIRRAENDESAYRRLEDEFVKG